MNSLIPSIKLAIENCKIIQSQMIAEKENIIPILRQARHINTGCIDLIESQYCCKIDQVQSDINGMESHLKELEIANAK